LYLLRYEGFLVLKHLIPVTSSVTSETSRGRGRLLSACDCRCSRIDTSDAYFESLESIQIYIIMCHS